MKYRYCLRVETPRRTKYLGKGQPYTSRKSAAAQFDTEDEALQLAARIRRKFDDNAPLTIKVEKVAVRASLNDAIDWIAEMDESASLDPEHVAGLPTVLLTSVLFGSSPEEIAESIIAARKKMFGTDD